MKVGFIGLGVMGAPMALNILKGGYELTVYDKSPEAIARLVQAGAKAAKTPKEVGAASEIVVTMLPEPQQFINPVPHMSFVWGEDNVAYLKKRYEALKDHPLFAGLEYSEDASVIRSWAPLLIPGRKKAQPIAATRIAAGTDVDFGSLTRLLLDGLLKDGVDLRLEHRVTSLKQRSDGSWRIKLGARVLVQLEALNTSARHAVALVDPLPAGFEAVNTNLATAERAAPDATSVVWDHVAMRDNRAEAFEMELPAGSHHFSYTVRATTPGQYVAAPAKAEEMYSPETFGRTAGTTVVIQ